MTIDMRLPATHSTNQPFFLTKLTIMTHSLLTPPAAAVAPITPPPPSQKILATTHHRSILRRDVLIGTAALVFGLNIDKNKNADAAARRPPPPPPTEKKDPNVSGVLAKVLASKRRKEAMKESMANLRNKGKPIINDDH